MITRGCVSYLHIHATLKGFLRRTICSYVIGLIGFFLVNVCYVHHSFIPSLFILSLYNGMTFVTTDSNVTISIVSF